jgi:transcription initiation factor IIE alpha subunit
MPLLYTCECGHVLRLKDEQFGKRLKCPRCAEIFTAGEKPAADKAAGRKSAARRVPALARQSPPFAPPSPNQ